MFCAGHHKKYVGENMIGGLYENLAGNSASQREGEITVKKLYNNDLYY